MKKRIQCVVNYVFYTDVLGNSSQQNQLRSVIVRSLITISSNFYGVCVLVWEVGGFQQHVVPQQTHGNAGMKHTMETHRYIWVCNDSYSPISGYRL